MSQFPPSPWNLKAQMQIGIFRVPISQLSLDLPSGVRPISLFGWGILGLSFIDYGPTGPNSILAYRELLAAVLVRRGWRVRIHIPAIWVDSEISRDGGRSLWAIPKELARFAFSSDQMEAHTQPNEAPIASLAPRLSPDGRRAPIFAPLTLVQKASNSNALETPFLLRGWVGFSGQGTLNAPELRDRRKKTASWTIPPSSPLSRLFQGARFLIQVTVPTAFIRFGK